MTDRCNACGHDWHGAAKCGESVTVEVAGSPVMWFTETGAGPNYGFDVKARPAKETIEVIGACCCRG